jgi:hypothetical protein
LIAAVCQLVRGRLHFSKEYLGKTIVMGDGQQFTVFRHMHLRTRNLYFDDSPTIFVVRFKFARLSYKINRILSCIPIPFIAGFPGFRDKVWMVNEKNGYWQGIYQWDSVRCAEDYKNSFVLSMMTKRAIPETISYEIVPKTSLEDYMSAGSGAEDP